MIDALVAGRIFGQPKAGSGKNGSSYVTAKVRTAGADNEPVLVSVITVADAVCQALLGMMEGESIALSGSLTPKVWVDKEGVSRPALDMQAYAIVTPYHINQRRAAANGEPPL